MLNHDPTGPMYEHGERMHLNRLKLAIKLRQKKVFDSLFFIAIIHLLNYFLFEVRCPSKCSTVAGKHLV